MIVHRDRVMLYVRNKANFGKQEQKRQAKWLPDQLKQKIINVSLNNSAKQDRIIKMLRERQDTNEKIRNIDFDPGEKMLVGNRPLLDNKHFSHNFASKIKKSLFKKYPLKSVAELFRGDPRLAGSYDKSPHIRTESNDPLAQMESNFFQRSPATGLTRAVTKILHDEYDAETSLTKLPRSKGLLRNTSLDLDKRLKSGQKFRRLCSIENIKVTPGDIISPTNSEDVKLASFSRYGPPDDTVMITHSKTSSLNASVEPKIEFSDTIRAFPSIKSVKKLRRDLDKSVIHFGEQPRAEKSTTKLSRLIDSKNKGFCSFIRITRKAR